MAEGCQWHRRAGASRWGPAAHAHQLRRSRLHGLEGFPARGSETETHRARQRIGNVARHLELMRGQAILAAEGSLAPARQSEGDWPVQRRNARVKQLPAENPNK